MVKALTISNLSKTYFIGLSEKVVVKNLSLEVKKGEVFGFLGPNGAGKTTTIKMVVGLSHPDKGKIRILGKPNQLISTRRKIGFMPENPYFYHHLSGYELLDFCAEIFDIKKPKRERLIKKLLGMVGLSDSAKLQLGKYSKGMNQRIGIAQSLINDPEIVFLDEPLHGLDPIGRKDIKNIILDLKKQGKTVFFNSHILADVEEVCDSIGIIDQGKLIKVGKVKQLLKRGENLEDFFVKTIKAARNPSVNSRPRRTSRT